MASKQSSPVGCVVVVLVVLTVIVGGVINLFNGGSASTDTTVTPDYSTYVPDDPADDLTVPADPSTDDGATDDGTGDGTLDDGGSVNLPGHGYVSGPGVNCSLGGCSAHVLPHFGWHF